MASMGGVKALAKQLWPKAANVEVVDSAADVTAPTGADPRQYQARASDNAGTRIDAVSADTLEELEIKLQAILKGQTP